MNEPMSRALRMCAAGCLAVGLSAAAQNGPPQHGQNGRPGGAQQDYARPAGQQAQRPPQQQQARPQQQANRPPQQQQGRPPQQANRPQQQANRPPHQANRPSQGQPQHARPPQWGRPPANRPSYNFRPNDRNYLRNYYASRLGRINRARRPVFRMGMYFPYAYIGYLSPVPPSMWGMLPPIPPGYQVGYYDGYVVVYDPVTYYIVGVIDLM